MAKITVDVSEFEKVREHIIKEENGPDWKLAKSFEQTTVYRKTDNDAIFKVRFILLVLKSTFFLAVCQ